jgi:adenylate cyclase
MEFCRMLKRAANRLGRDARWLVPLVVLGAMLAVRTAMINARANSRWSGLEGLQQKALDAFLNKAPRPYQDVGVRIIDINEESITKIGQWPWPRTKIAELIRRLKELGVSAIALDMVFPEGDRTSPARVVKLWPDDPSLSAIKRRVAQLPDHDELLARAFRADGRVVAGFAPGSGARSRPVEPKAQFSFGGDGPLGYLDEYPNATDNLPQLDAAAAGLGSFGFEGEHDGVIRRVPLLFNVENKLLPALSLEAVRVARGQTNISIKSSGGSDAGGFGQHTGISRIRVGSLTIPTDAHARVWVDYTRAEPSRVIPAWQVLDRSQDVDLKGKIAFVGTSAAGLLDLRSTPLSPIDSGVTVHANVAEQILSGTFLERPDWADGAEITLTFLLGVVLLALLHRLGAAWSAPIGAGMIVGALWTAWHAFTAWHQLIDPVFPSVALAAVYFSFAGVAYVRSDRERRAITDTFGRYLSPKVVAELAKSGRKVELGGETREMTFHFCDIRGFTTISESFDPHGLTAFINRFLTPMTQIVLEHDGTIDKYMGDCIMAFWNAPQTVPDHPRKACAAALAMHAKLDALNAQWQAEAKAAGKTLPEIHIGTGLNTGPCVVGNMGSTLRVDYTVLGDDVNLASRLEGQSKSYGVRIVIGPVTRERAPEFAALELDLLKVKGKTKPVRIFALLGDAALAGSEGFRALARVHEALLAAYRRQDWEEAESLLKEARGLGAAWSLDKLYHLYEERIAALRADPPGAGWDGVAVALTK